MITLGVSLVYKIRYFFFFLENGNYWEVFILIRCSHYVGPSETIVWFNGIPIMGLFHYNPILCLSMESGHFYSVSFSLTLPFSHVKKSSHSARSQSRPLLLPSSLASNSPPQVNLSIIPFDFLSASFSNPNKTGSKSWNWKWQIYVLPKGLSLSPSKSLIFQNFPQICSRFICLYLSLLPFWFLSFMIFFLCLFVCLSISFFSF